jgi:hypothetical protein
MSLFDFFGWPVKDKRMYPKLPRVQMTDDILREYFIARLGGTIGQNYAQVQLRANNVLCGLVKDVAEGKNDGSREFTLTDGKVLEVSFDQLGRVLGQIIRGKNRE